MHVASTVRITNEPGRATSGDLSALQRWQVAARSGGDFIRLSIEDSWANLKTLDDHFARRGADFGAKSADNYERMSSESCQRGGAQHPPTKIAPDGTIPTWVGDGFTVASDGKTLISRDGLRQWRPPSYKPYLDKWQSNFESRPVPSGQWQGNGHRDITDLP